MTKNYAETPVAEQLQDLILSSEDVDDFLEDLAVFSSDILGGGVEVHCGVTLKRDKRAITVASSSAQAKLLDEVQYGFGDGPCLHAIATEHTTVISDVRTDNRWPDYFAAVAEFGFYSMMGVPLILGQSGGAALNFYAREPDTFGPDAVRIAEGYAAQASRALQLALRLAHRSETADHLKRAMDSRTTIDLAVGIIMGQNRCSQDEAFIILKNASSSRNVKLREIAAGIVSSIGQGPAETFFED
jgi:GAF domain-containing protein